MITRALVATSLLCSVSTSGADTKVTVGSPTAPYNRNSSNEPAVAIDPLDSDVVVAGANDFIDNRGCVGSFCNPTPDVGGTGIYFSFNGGLDWIQPSYPGLSGRTGTVEPGPIGTVPNFYENGLVSHGDPWVAFGPRPGPTGFDWANGSRLYYSSLAGNLRGLEFVSAATVSYADDLLAAAGGDATAWSAPRIVTRDNQNELNDKESVWVDNAASSPYFGTVYTCSVNFRRHGVPVMMAVSTDGGDTWRKRQISQAAQNYEPEPFRFDRQGCVVRTDSHGVVYVFWSAIQNHQMGQYLSRSFNGGRSFHPATLIITVTECGQSDPVSGRPTFDGVAGTRTNSLPAVDIANGAPTGADATDELALAWCDEGLGVDHEQALVIASTDGGESWSEPVNAAEFGDRPCTPAVAISPDGRDAYLVYDAFLDPWQSDTASPRRVQGVVLHSPIAGGLLLGWSTLHRGEPGDARATSRQLNREFIYDYNQVAATRSGAVALWTDARNAVGCPVIDAYRQSLLSDTPLPDPSPIDDCPDGFGNGDIYAAAVNP